jgi:hypothetical protein
MRFLGLYNLLTSGAAWAGPLAMSALSQWRSVYAASRGVAGLGLLSALWYGLTVREVLGRVRNPPTD